jgi:hypothetical protein
LQQEEQRVQQLDLELEKLALMVALSLALARFHLE